MNVLEKHDFMESTDWDAEFSPRDLARIFFELRARTFGLSSFSVDASLKNPRVYKCFLKLSESLERWGEEGLHVNVGVYFKALFKVFKANTYPSHVVAECGLPIYFKFKEQSIKSAPELTVEQQMSYRESKIKQAMLDFNWSREEVIERFSFMLPEA